MTEQKSRMAFAGRPQITDGVAREAALHAADIEKLKHCARDLGGDWDVLVAIAVRWPCTIKTVWIVVERYLTGAPPPLPGTVAEAILVDYVSRLEAPV